MLVFASHGVVETRFQEHAERIKEDLLNPGLSSEEVHALMKETLGAWDTGEASCPLHLFLLRPHGHCNRSNYHAGSTGRSDGSGLAASGAFFPRFSPHGR